MTTSNAVDLSRTDVNQTIDLSQYRVLDGGLATELERRGISLDGILWSARALRDAPEAILAVHRDYLAAGADCLLTASYQASTLGFAEAFARQENVAGFELDTEDEFETRSRTPLESAPEAAVEFSQQARIFAMARAATRAALAASVRLAAQARAEYYAAGGTRPILIAVSLGPYGAALHNGAEFHGNYNASFSELVDFHRERIAMLAPAGELLTGEPSSGQLSSASSRGAALLAFETVPSLEEARAIVAALAGFPKVQAWVSFSCRDTEHVAHGERLSACAALLDLVPQVVAVGINCTPPALITPLLAELQAGTAKPSIVYPNSGEGWDAVRRCWTGASSVDGYGALAEQWFAAGVQMAGGCCRTGPAHIRAVAEAAASRPI